MKTGFCIQVPSLPRGFHIRRLFVKLAMVQIPIYTHLLNLNELHNVLTGKCMFKHIVGRKGKRRMRLIKGLIRLKNNQGEKYSYYIVTCHLELFPAVVHH